MAEAINRNQNGNGDTNEEAKTSTDRDPLDECHVRCAGLGTRL